MLINIFRVEDDSEKNIVVQLLNDTEDEYISELIMNEIIRELRTDWEFV